MTDARLPSGLLQDTLAAGADRSFNRVTVDGDTSTNDTILLLAADVRGLAWTVRPRVPCFKAFWTR